jgi:hypothetical protein
MMGKGNAESEMEKTPRDPIRYVARILKKMSDFECLAYNGCPYRNKCSKANIFVVVYGPLEVSEA